MGSFWTEGLVDAYYSGHLPILVVLAFEVGAVEEVA